MEKINVGIIGFGLSGRVFHSSLLKANSDFQIKKIFSSKKEKVHQIFPDVEVTESLDNIFSDPKLNLIIICGPNETHYEQTKRALLFGKNVVVEKPFVVNSIEGEELIKIAEDKNLILSVFQNRRWDSDFLTIKKIISEDRLGTIKQFESHFDRWRPSIRENKWKEKPGAGTGIFYDLGVHLIDQCLELFGLPDEVFADIDDQKLNKGVVDYFHVILKYKKMRAVLHSSSFSHKNDRFIILGDKANFRKSGLDPQEGLLVQGISPNDENFGIEKKESFGLFQSDDEERLIKSERGEYMSFYNYLADAIKKGDNKLTPVSARSALEVIKVLETSIESNQAKRWVTYKKR